MVIPIAMTVGTSSSEKGALQSKVEPIDFWCGSGYSVCSQDTKESRFYRESLSKLRLAVKDLNSYKLDFVVTLGDVIDKNFKSFADIMPV